VIVTGGGPAIAAGASAALRAGEGSACVAAVATVADAFGDSTGRFVCGFGASFFVAGLLTGAGETVTDALAEARGAGVVGSGCAVAGAAAGWFSSCSGAA
jgi:hypothetical protein